MNVSRTLIFLAPAVLSVTKLKAGMVLPVSVLQEQLGMAWPARLSQFKLVLSPTWFGIPPLPPVNASITTTLMEFNASIALEGWSSIQSIISVNVPRV